MSDVDIGTLTGVVSGSFVTQKFFSGEVATGASGDILTITAPLGKRLRLDYLATDADPESNIEIHVDGVLVNQSSTYLGAFSDANLDRFKVIQGGSSTASTISDVVGREIIVKRTSGSTTNPINYAYSEGV